MATVTTMTTEALPAHLERHALTAVFLLAILAIVGLVALVAQGPGLPAGVRLVSAQGDVAGQSPASDSGDNIAGQVINSRYQTTLFHYRSYDSITRVVEFREIRSNMWFNVPLDSAGKGAIVYMGVDYKVQAIPGISTTGGPTLKIDTNADGSLDTAVNFGKQFLIYYR